MAEQTQPSQQAVWYFAGATFLFVFSSTLFDSSSGWLRFAFTALGILAMVAGFVRLRREMRARGGKRPSGHPDSQP